MIVGLAGELKKVRFLIRSVKLTLTVEAYYYKEQERITLEHLFDGGGSLAGVESCRTKLYGSQKAIDLGLVLLPKLKKVSVISCEGSELSLLENEIKLLIDVYNEVEDNNTFLIRLNNVLVAVKEAQKFGSNGGVLIG